MPSFNSLNELNAYILSKVQKATEISVANDVKQLESKNVNDIVYSSYSPRMYERDMLEGGLADTDNMHHDIATGINSVELTVENKTLNNPDYNPYNKSPFEIAGLVEYGSDNGYGYYDYPRRNKDPEVYTYLQPRPFIEKTKQDLEDGKAREFYVKGLRSQGLNAI